MKRIFVIIILLFSFSLALTPVQKLFNEGKYDLFIKSQAPKREKAKACLNLGNSYFRQDQVDVAVKACQQGLEFDPNNKRLKHNLEIFLKLQKEKKQNNKQDQQKQKSEQAKQAEKMLDALKGTEEKAMIYNSAGDKKQNVEKDW